MTFKFSLTFVTKSKMAAEWTLRATFFSWEHVKSINRHPWQFKKPGVIKSQRGCMGTPNSSPTKALSGLIDGRLIRLRAGWRPSLFPSTLVLRCGGGFESRHRTSSTRAHRCKLLPSARLPSELKGRIKTCVCVCVLCVLCGVCV